MLCFYSWGQNLQCLGELFDLHIEDRQIPDFLPGGYAFAAILFPTGHDLDRSIDTRLCEERPFTRKTLIIAPCCLPFSLLKDRKGQAPVSLISAQNLAFGDWKKIYST